jgi:TPR repeat protein
MYITLCVIEQAAKENDPEAMLMLANCYSQGLGVDLDEHLSTQWIEKAASIGCPGALHKQGVLFYMYRYICKYMYMYIYICIYSSIDRLS